MRRFETFWGLTLHLLAPKPQEMLRRRRRQVRSAKKAKKATDEVEDEDDGEDVQAAKTVSWMGKPKKASHLLSDVKGAYEADVPKDHRMYYEELELE